MYYLKQDCRGCKALSEVENGYICELKYPLTAYYNSSPLKPCPKPKGWMRFVHCLQHETYKMR